MYVVFIRVEYECVQNNRGNLAEFLLGLALSNLNHPDYILFTSERCMGI